MDEDKESSSINYQKTVSAQKERTVDVGKEKGRMGFIYALRGKHVYGSVESSYQAGRGGYVNTSISSGRGGAFSDAILHQRWGFDREGGLTDVSISKVLQGAGEASRTVLVRGDDGKFNIKEHKVNGLLGEWEEKFNTAAQRLKT